MNAVVHVTSANTDACVLTSGIGTDSVKSRLRQAASKDIVGASGSRGLPGLLAVHTFTKLQSTSIWWLANRRVPRTHFAVVGGLRILPDGINASPLLPNPYPQRVKKVPQARNMNQ